MPQSLNESVLFIITIKVCFNLVCHPSDGSYIYEKRHRFGVLRLVSCHLATPVFLRKPGMDNPDLLGV